MMDQELVWLGSGIDGRSSRIASRLRHYRFLRVDGVSFYLLRRKRDVLFIYESWKLNAKDLSEGIRR